MLVSVIIPTYNEEKVIGECLKSLAKQTFKDFEMIVVDDGSADKTLRILRSLQSPITQPAEATLQALLAGHHPSLIVLHQKHLGPGKARNFGAKKAKGEILVFVDADMTFDKNFISNLIKPIAGGKAKGTFSKYEYVSNWENVWARCWNVNESWEEKRRHPKNYPDRQKVFRAILKKEFDRVGGFDPSAGYMDDWTLSRKLGYEAVSAPGAIFYHENPESLGEVFRQARWIGKRPYKLGIIGDVVALVRASFPVSLIVGTVKSFTGGQPGFLVFKFVYDFGIFIGILDKLLSRNLAK